MRGADLAMTLVFVFLQPRWCIKALSTAVVGAAICANICPGSCRSLRVVGTGNFSVLR